MPTRTLSRRDFLKVTGITLGTGVVACSGLTALATHSPVAILPESTYGEQNISKKILVAYASKRGSTGEVASAIGKTLAQTGARVDVLPLKKVTDLASYQAVFVGSAIRVAKWLPEASDFISENRAVLQRIPTAYFTVCATLFEDTPAKRAKAAEFLEPVRTVFVPAAEGYFAGKVDPKTLSFLENTMLKSRGVPQGDFRNWEKITDWAQSTYAQLCA
ncbi:MAG TPA: flavodoxin domain-containing protein [Anaerolineales bacterium]|nr:flavodoxin domain-containing protein [Anaerolineales bacterium]